MSPIGTSRPSLHCRNGGQSGQTAVRGLNYSGENDPERTSSLYQSHQVGCWPEPTLNATGKFNPLADL
jgi:hypothetical protein